MHFSYCKPEEFPKISSENVENFFACVKRKIILLGAKLGDDDTSNFLQRLQILLKNLEKFLSFAMNHFFSFCDAGNTDAYGEAC